MRAIYFALYSQRVNEVQKYRYCFFFTNLCATHKFESKRAYIYMQKVGVQNTRVQHEAQMQQQVLSQLRSQNAEAAILPRNDRELIARGPSTIIIIIM